MSYQLFNESTNFILGNRFYVTLRILSPDVLFK